MIAEINTLEEMCDIMCDNVIPEEEERAMSDLIRRQDAIEAVQKVWCNNDDQKDFKQRYYEMGNNDAVEDAIGYIDALPSAEPKTGEWVGVEKDEYEGFSIVNMRCNQCRKYAYLVLPKGTKCVYDYCPNCGTKMVGEDGEA